MSDYQLLYDAAGQFIGLRIDQTTHSPAGLAALASQLQQAQQTINGMGKHNAALREELERRAVADAEDLHRLQTTYDALARERDGLRLALVATSEETDRGVQREAALAVLLSEVREQAHDLCRWARSMSADDRAQFLADLDRVLNVISGADPQAHGAALLQAKRALVAWSAAQREYIGRFEASEHEGDIVAAEHRLNRAEDEAHTAADALRAATTDQ